jgi:thioredoxin-related protein
LQYLRSQQPIPLRIVVLFAVCEGDDAMKKSVLIVIALALVGLLATYGFSGRTGTSGNAWQKNITWTDPGISLDTIKALGKPVYLFVTTEWCTFCKRMKSETFGDTTIQQKLNTLFTNITVNPETNGTANFTGEGLSYQQLAKKLRVSGYPASFFFGPDGKLIGGQAGYLDPTLFADLADYIGGGYYINQSFSAFQDQKSKQNQ